MARYDHKEVRRAHLGDEIAREICEAILAEWRKNNLYPSCLKARIKFMLDIGVPSRFVTDTGMWLGGYAIKWGPLQETDHLPPNSTRTHGWSVQPI